MTDRNVIVSGLITGTVLGIVTGVLLAPKAGKVTRRFLRIKTTDFRSRVQSYVSKLRLRSKQVE